jgi:hypothetical protein
MRSHSSVIVAPEATQSHAPFARPAKMPLKSPQA